MVSLRLVLFRLYSSLYTLMISLTLPLFILLYLLMILVFICQTPKNDHWRRANKLSLNNKTNYMLLNSQKYNLTSFKVIINNYNISSKIA